MAKINEAVGEKNCLEKSGGGKRLVCPCRMQEFWEYIGCILSAVTYGKKGHNLWGETPTYFGNNPQTKLQRDVCGNTDSHSVCCDLYYPHYCYDFH